MFSAPPMINGKALCCAWPYYTMTGALLGGVGRYEDAQGSKIVIPLFKLPKESKHWRAGAAPAPRPLFGMETLNGVSVDERIYIAEGEKATAALHRLGLPAVSSCGGCQQVNKADWDLLNEYSRFCICLDNDEPGEVYAVSVARELRQRNSAVQIDFARFSDFCKGADAVDLIQRRIPDWDGYADHAGFQDDSITSLILEDLDNLVEQNIELPALDTPELELPEWEEIVPLDLFSPPLWPADVFPEELQRIVDALAESTQTPIELPAMLSLAMVATAAQNQYVVRIHDSYMEPINLWTCAVLESGNRKSAVLDALRAPIVEYEAQRREELAPQIRKVEIERGLIDEKIKKLKQSGKSTQLLSAEILQLENSKPAMPYARAYWTNDVTPEKLAELMERNGGVMSILSDEGGIIDTINGRYNRGVPNADVFLQGYSGGGVRVHRKSGPEVLLDRACLTMGLSPQPAVIRAIGEKKALHGRGLFERFLYALPHSRLGMRRHDVDPIDPAARNEYASLIMRILQCGEAVGGDFAEAQEIILDSAAEESRRQFALFVEEQMRDGERYAEMRAWASKLMGTVCRIAALLHIVRYAYADPAAVPLAVKDMNAAIRIADKLGDHAAAAFKIMHLDKTLVGAERILRWIAREGKDQFTLRNCHYAHRTTFGNAKEVAAALDILEGRNYIRNISEQKPQKRGRPSCIYAVNPKVLADSVLL